MCLDWRIICLCVKITFSKFSTYKYNNLLKIFKSFFAGTCLFFHSPFTAPGYCCLWSSHSCVTVVEFTVHINNAKCLSRFCSHVQMLRRPVGNSFWWRTAGRPTVTEWVSPHGIIFRPVGIPHWAPRPGSRASFQVRGKIQPPAAGRRLSVFTLVSAAEAVTLGRDGGGEIWNKSICSCSLFLFFSSTATFLIIFPLSRFGKF